ncbi:MAG TPA: GAP family protein [Acidimicrobiales bacterium]|nr:GAP family protein [Acidimicrobiales bacterium]
MWDLVLIGVVITLEPLPVIGFILLLAGKRGVVNGLAYIAGWVATLVAIVVGTLAVTGGHPPASQSAPGRGVAIGTVVIGLFLVVVGVRQHLRLRTNPPSKPPPKWMGKLDGMSPWAAAGLGFLLQPWALVAAGVASVADADLSSAASVTYLVLFCVLSTSSILAMEGYVVFAHEDATGRLDNLRGYLDSHRDRGIELLALVVGLVVMAKGIYELVSG